MFGILNLYKPAGVTSRDVVNQVQRLVKPHKAGHAGTLDPLATGVLVVCVGPATRLVEYVQRMPKHYCGEFLLGRSSETDDIEGTVVATPAAPVPTRDALDAALPGLIGEILQRPPAFSALKVQGRRAYDLARRGAAVKLAPRPVTVYRLEILSYEYPRLRLDVECGSGTYIRALGRDLAQAVGTAAVMSALCRTAVGRFRLEEATAADKLTRENIVDHLLPAARAVADLPQVQLTAAECERLRCGQAIENRERKTATELAALGPDGELAALLTAPTPHQLRPTRCFLPQPPRKS